MSAILRSVPEGTAGIWPLGQSGMVIRFARAVVAVDLYLSNHCEAIVPRPFDHRRMTRAPLDPAELEAIDIVISTHEHPDHFDVPTLRTLQSASPRSILVTPASVTPLAAQLDWPESRVVGTNGDERFEIGGVEIEAFGVPHEEYEVDPKLGHRYQGYAIRQGGISVAHVGDARADHELGERLRQIQPTVVCLPINGRDADRAEMGFAGNMNAEEAAELARDSGAHLVFPMHDDMFEQNIDREARDRFTRAMQSATPHIIRPRVGDGALVSAEGELLSDPNYLYRNAL